MHQFPKGAETVLSLAVIKRLNEAVKQWSQYGMLKIGFRLPSALQGFQSRKQ